MKEIRYYKSFDEDFTESKNQHYTLPENYQYIRESFFERIFSDVAYFLLFVFGFFYSKCVLHQKIVGREKLKEVKENYFLYGNHTQPLGDVFLPALITSPKRFYAVVSRANLGVAVVGKILPFVGAIPIPDNIKKMKDFSSAVHKRYSEGYPIAIYPEAHVWEYMKDIRPFDDTAFSFPIKENAPVFTFTSTYQKRRFFKKPKMTVYIDGPFYPAPSLSPRERRKELHSKVYSKLKERSNLSNTEYIRYENSIF